MSEKHYETLDPENWEEMRQLAHRMVDDAIDYLENARERPVWTPVQLEVLAPRIGQTVLFKLEQFQP